MHQPPWVIWHAPDGRPSTVLTTMVHSSLVEASGRKGGSGGKSGGGGGGNGEGGNGSGEGAVNVHCWSTVPSMVPLIKQHSAVMVLPVCTANASPVPATFE